MQFSQLFLEKIVLFWGVVGGEFGVRMMSRMSRRVSGIVREIVVGEVWRRSFHVDILIIFKSGDSLELNFNILVQQ